MEDGRDRLKWTLILIHILVFPKIRMEPKSFKVRDSNEMSFRFQIAKIGGVNSVQMFRYFEGGVTNDAI